MAKPKDEKEKKIFRLTEMEPHFVSLVTAGANRQKKFQVVKTEKAVPDKDADTEQKNADQQARSKKYGIEILSTGSNLSYPAGDPTDEGLYGDPVNLKYPLGDESNETDLGRVRNALARFKQNFETYSEKAIGVVYGRIVAAALDAGVEVSYDAEDEVDKKLPESIVSRLTEKSECLNWLNKVGDAVQNKFASTILEVALSEIQKMNEPSTIQKSFGPSETDVVLHEMKKQNDQMKTDLAVLKKENEEMTATMNRMQKENSKLQAQLSKMRRGLGGPTAIVTGEVSVTPKQSTPAAPLFNAGRDMAPRLKR